MVNINGWQAQFIKRLESVGWSVERTQSNHFKVRDAKNKFLFTFPTTPGDVRSMKNTEADAKRHGLPQLEHNAKLLAERERLERIQRDREESDAAAAVEAEARIDADLAKLGKSIEHHPDLGTVDGVAILMSGPALFKTPVMAEARPLRDAEELLLADDRTVWRCLKSAATPYRPHAEGLCHKVYLSVDSLQSHLAYHSRTPWKEVKNPDVADATTARKEEDQTVPTTKTPVKTAELNGHRPEIEAFDHALSQLQAGVKRIADASASLIIEIGTLRDASRRLPVVDQATIDKAAQFDALGAIFKNAAGK